MFEIFNICYCDAAEVWQINFQDPATPIMEGMFIFHNYLVNFLIVIGVFVLWMLYSAFQTNSSISSKFSHSSILEIVWTIIPAVILVLIAIPSFTLLYSLDELSDPLVTIKIVGHQWYWSYEFSDYVTKLNESSSLNFDSYMVGTDDLSFGSFRLLEVDNRLILPINTHIRLLITSSDVIHCWVIPSFGLKVDATPGRLSQASLYIKREGVFYGQCSEICGVNHGFMPIVVKAVAPSNFVQWVANKLN
jgi:cytochrome c oxidase subunit 2